MRKSKVILGVGLTFILVASLALSALPAAAGTLSWSYVNTPQGTYQQLQVNTDVDFLVAAPDGTTLFDYDNVGQLLYQSSDAGVTWTTTNIGATLEGKAVTAMAVSPNYASDLTVVAATAGKVFRSQNGGATFGEVSTAQLVAASGAGAGTVAITSIDIAQYYIGGELAILVGTADGDAGEHGGAFLCRLDTWTWTDLQVGNAAAGTGAAGGVYDVTAVAFSPNHTGDAQILAVGSTAAATVLTTKFAANNWAVDVLDANIGAIVGVGEAANDITHAVIAFADDYEWSSNNRVLVGVESASATLDDVYRVHGGLPGGASVAYDLNVNGTTAECEVWSIAVSGGITGATVIVGQAASTNVKRTADPTTSTVTWSSATKAPTGDAAAPNVIVLLAADFATSNKIMVGTGGTDSAFSVSNDGGVTFNGIALIDVSSLAATFLIYKDISIVDANTMFLLIYDDVGATGAIAAGDLQMVFKTTDAGATWIRVLHKRATAASGLAIVAASPNYATDSTLYVAESGSTRLWKSTNGGDSFIGLAAPAVITALTVVDGNTYFTGHNALVYKSGHWNSGAVTANVVSIALSPDFANDDTVIVGNDDGDVYLSSNASATVSVLYTRQGVDDSLGNTQTVSVAPHPDFATNSLIFAGSRGVGVWRTTAGSGSWGAAAIDAVPAVNGLALSNDGSIYAADNTGGTAVRRSVDPERTSAAPTFETMGAATYPAGTVMRSITYIPGSNVLYGLVDSIGTPPTAYPHKCSILTFTDTFAVAPTLVSPTVGATNVGTTVDFSWEVIESPAGITPNYTLTTATDAAFAAFTVQSAAITGTTFRVVGLTAGRQYWWSISTAAGAPLRSRSAIGNFVVALTPFTPSAALTSPAPGASGVSVVPNFQWAPVAGATGYRIQLSTSSSFAETLVNQLLETSVWTYDGTLDNSTDYYWRVKAVSPDTESGWSVGVFTTAAAPAAPAPPVTVTQAPAIPVPTITLSIPPAPAPTTITIPPQPAPVTTQITPAWIYAIIAVGAVLVIAVIVLIVRTRRAI